MKPTWPLRIAAILSLLTAAGHTAGAPWTPDTGMASRLLLGSMKSLQFDAMGATRSYWDFYYGFGLNIGVYLFAQALLLWLVGGLPPRQGWPMILVLMTASLASAVIAGLYLFVLPLALMAAVTACIAWALVLAWRAG